MHSKFTDNHAHSLLRNQLQLDKYQFRSCWTESRYQEIIEQHVPTQYNYIQLLDRLGELLGVRGEDNILAKRSRFGQQEYVRLLWDDANISELVVDNGFRSDAMYALDELERLSGRRIHECRRIEAVLEHCLATTDSFSALHAAYSTQLFDSSSAGTPVALKTIMAYRGGLKLLEATPAQAQANYAEARAQAQVRNFRIEKSQLYHYMLMQAFEMAACHDIPVQVHTGIGDDDALLVDSNPALLQPLFQLTTLRHTRWLLLHCYPYVREAAFLCSLYPNVYMDLSLALNIVSPLVPHLVSEAYACAPASKIVTATDGHSIPETHWHAALRWQDAVSHLPEDLVKQAQPVHRLPTDASGAAD